MALLGIIRRWHIRDQVPLREIARRLGISRNTVRRYLRSETIEPAYAERRSSRAIDKYAFQLSALLKTEAARTRKQRRTLKQIHEDLKELGFEGSYDRVAAFARVWRAGQSDRVNPASKRTLAWLQGYDLAFSALNGELDLPQKDLSALIRMIQSNQGTLSANRRKQYYYLPETVLNRIEEVVRQAFETTKAEAGAPSES